ncbi:hypothetical protein SLNWT_2845 [Streptomyces albus]|uniref:Uncharacterized protein n=1 Tax=Streptomyces albus (strain ATCC 21838 / DSM 41398 / FERM P-419 / JCM 4703 / NBRC 107858) TaxID=1081613 RepID=A0A0B5EX05_STRA4|nr:hypothetical protein SLNWT_2845 [Streptomyces albus]AOU77534.1 hypothetical protein SLNHY_2843 [Streptomyces albus]AYN33305.1 hypothetical protein DUI70_2804 [Streptomyces albus]
MQPPQPSAPPPPAAPQGPAPAPRRTGLLLGALVVGLLVGAGGVGAAWALGGDDGGSGSGAGAAGDARGACAALDGFDESQYGAKGDEGLVALNRWSGAVTLSAAAAAGDPEYRPLAEALNRAQQRHAREFTFDAEAKKDLAKARGICADL